MINSFSNVKIGDRTGDPTGKREYKVVSSEPINKWMKVFDTWVRKNI